MWDFFPPKRSEKLLCRESFQIWITSIEDMFPYYKNSANVVFAIPVSSMAIKQEFSLHLAQIRAQISYMDTFHATEGEMFIITTYCIAYKSAQYVIAQCYFSV